MFHIFIYFNQNFQLEVAGSKGWVTANVQSWLPVLLEGMNAVALALTLDIQKMMSAMWSYFLLPPSTKPPAVCRASVSVTLALDIASLFGCFLLKVIHTRPRDMSRKFRSFVLLFFYLSLLPNRLRRRFHNNF